MPHRTRPMTALLVFTGLNVVLVSTITPVYDFVCFLPYWERRCRSTLKFGPTIACNLFFHFVASQIVINCSKTGFTHRSSAYTNKDVQSACWGRERRRLEREALAHRSQSS
ncbi:hypothetical protein SCA6_013578 [Theobroma cacao]|uniref:Uncharacterized protein n=1 Tax=Theobroma cacao TaxID=3641 RepID=A0A061DIY8_THECC|nr:Uncharacterized protein TCM_001457 [Theobroma cacao]